MANMATAASSKQDHSKRRTKARNPNGRASKAMYRMQRVPSPHKPHQKGAPGRCAVVARSNSQPTPRTLAVESSARRTEHGGARRWEPASHPGPPLPASRQQSHIPGAPQMRLIRAARAHPGESSPHRSAPRAIDDGALARVYARGGRAHERGRPRWTKLTRRLLRDTAERETRPIIGGESAIRASRSQRPERSITPPLAAPPVQFDSWPSRSIEGRDYGLVAHSAAPRLF
ncbi:hypothetical protein B0H10DRAFT_2345945 [Mycena sp. CBHHK59/15]|nr:hypothetical protein B0H10DRAFT_2345945 [Mycena sp. CBHHK59/15]